MVDRLSEAEQIRLAEATHLRQTLGEKVWPGWQTADIPLLVYNESYAFMLGLYQPSDGWIKTPESYQRGGRWQPLPEPFLDGSIYYRQAISDGAAEIGSFTVRVDGHWVASLTTREWMKISLRQQIRQYTPSFLEPFFPYRLIDIFLVNTSDWYIAVLLHESFHAYQGTEADGRLEAIESDVSTARKGYPDDASFVDAWQAELDLWSLALLAEDDSQAADLARQALEQRSMRRLNYHLSEQAIQFEQQREWLEGLAKYVELAIWRQAAQDSTYQPLAETEKLDDFKRYKTFDARWKQEVDQVRRMADSDGDGRFYYSGMAQAFLLDRLMPGWKSYALQPDVWLEELLRQFLDH